MTDFRIAGLSIAELGWEWKTETDKIKSVVAEILAKAEGDEKVEGDDLAEVEKGEGEDDETDMSISSPVKPSVDAPEEAVVNQPKKKLTKKQRKAEAAASKALLDSSSSTVAATIIETTTSDVKAEEIDESAIETPVVDGAEPTTSQAEEKKKDGNKHGRDEEDGEAGLVPDVKIVAKKVKPDNDEIVTLASIDPDSSMIVPSSPSSQAKSSSSLPVKPPPFDSKLPIPTGPRASTMPAPQAPPTNRENSRLRIYFSSPVASAAPLVVQSDKPVEVIVPPPSASTSKLSEVVVVEEVEAEAKAEAEADDAVAEPKEAEEQAEEQAEEEYDDDVDGEPVADLDGEEVVEIKEELDEDSDSEDVASSLLLARQTTLPRPEESTDATADVSSPAATEEADPTPVEIEAPKPQVALPEPSPDRISISYARNTRRLVVDAGVVNSVKIFRAEGKIELKVAFESATLDMEEEGSTVDAFRVCRGVIVSLVLFRGSYFSLLTNLLRRLNLSIRRATTTTSSIESGSRWHGKRNQRRRTTKKQRRSITFSHRCIDSSPATRRRME